MLGVPLKKHTHTNSFFNFPLVVFGAWPTSKDEQRQVGPIALGGEKRPTLRHFGTGLKGMVSVSHEISGRVLWFLKDEKEKKTFPAFSEFR